jgi:hypothetical protein
MWYGEALFFSGDIMHARLCFGVIAAGFALLCPFSFAQTATSADARLASIVKTFLASNFDTDWSGLEKLPGIRWAPLPPTMLQNCLPDGGCFTRQGTTNIGGRNIAVLATGARTIVSHLYLRNSGAAIGEAPAVAAVKQAGFTAELARCPLPGGTGGTDWYRLKAPNSEPGYLAVQSSCNGRVCEGFTLTIGPDLPPLQPNQLRLYSEQCSGGSSARKAVSAASPQETLAQALIAYIPAAAGPAFYTWKTLPTLVPSAEWLGSAPKQFGSDPYSLSGNIKLAQRAFSLVAAGTQTQVKNVTFDENQMHPKEEDVLGLFRQQGLDVRLARCGPVYTESTNNWYSITSAKTHPVMLKQSIRYEGKQAQDAYELRLDNTLPKRDPRDRDPGVNGCR